METLSPTIVGHLSALADMLADVRRSDHSAALGLGRAQRLAIARAQSLGRRSVDLRLAGGRDVTVVLSPEGKPVIAPSNRPTRPSATPSAGVCRRGSR
jgi:hypothetical protein